MRKITIAEHVSLDGVIAAGGKYEDTPFANGWTTPYRTPAGAKTLAERYGERYDLLLGRRTYDQWAGFWPNAPVDNPFTKALNAATKYVATHRPDGLTWGPAQSLGTDVVKGIRDLKATDGPNLILSGSGMLASLVLEHGLADEVLLLVYPVLLGAGKRFFSDRADPRELAFVSTTTTATGVLVNLYRHVGAFAPR